MQFTRALGLSFSLLVIVLSVSRAEAVFTFRNTAALGANTGFDAGAQAIALVDVNKDNRADILVVDTDNNVVQLFLNDGHGGFPSFPTNLGTGLGPIAVATGDFNGDGFVDLVTLNGDADTVTVRLNDGTGNFPDSGSRDFNVNSGAIAVAVGDFDNDGDADIATLNDNTIYLLKSNGNGTFTPFPTATLPTGPGTSTSGGHAIIATQINRDSNLDLVATNHDSSNISVLLGNGNGTFQSPQVRQVGDTPDTLIAALLNNDAFQDLAVVLERTGAESDRNIQLLYGNGDGTFQNNDTRTTANQDAVCIGEADFDNDGQPDLASGNISDMGGLVMLCNADGTCFDSSPFANPAEPTNSSPSFQQQLIPSDNTVAVAAGNINGDALPDLIELSEDGATITVLINTTGQAPTPSPTPGHPTPTPLASATATPVGPSPTVTASSTAVATATPTPIPVPYGVCALNANTTPAIGGRPVAVTSGILKLKHQRFIAVADAQNNQIVIVTSQLNTQSADPCARLGLAVEQASLSVNAPVAVVAQDFDGDGFDDVAAVGSQGLSVFYGDGNGAFRAGNANPMPSGSIPSGLAVGDFNRDGRPDIMVATAATTGVSIFLNAGGGTFQPACNIQVGNRSASLVVADDLNGDNREDFALTSAQTPDLSVFIRVVPGGTPTPVPPLTCPTTSDFTGLTTLGVGGVPSAMVADTFDLSDTLPDFAITRTDGRVVIFLGKPVATSPGVVYQSGVPFSLPAANGTAPLPSAAGAGDIDRDGREDLVVADKNNNQVVIFYGLGDGTFRAGQPVPVDGHHPVGLAMADLDGDSRPDIVTANAGDPTLSGISILISSLPPPTPTAPPTATPTVTATPTLTSTVTPSVTSTPPPTGTQTRTATPFPSQTPLFTAVPTNTIKMGSVSLNGSCAIDPGPPSWQSSAWMLAVVALLFKRLQRWAAVDLRSARARHASSELKP